MVASVLSLGSLTALVPGGRVLWPKREKLEERQPKDVLQRQMFQIADSASGNRKRMDAHRPLVADLAHERRHRHGLHLFRIVRGEQRQQVPRVQVCRSSFHSESRARPAPALPALKRAGSQMLFSAIGFADQAEFIGIEPFGTRNPVLEPSAFDRRHIRREIDSHLTDPHFATALDGGDAVTQSKLQR
jgi:hypothetical protein